MKIITRVLPVLTIVALAGCAGLNASQMPTRTADGVLTDANGMTLYVFERDLAGNGKSACLGQCATNWPALQATANAMPSGDYAVITRADGVQQWTYKGQPLYRWVKDKKAGDKTGDGVNKVWHVAKP